MLRTRPPTSHPLLVSLRIRTVVRSLPGLLPLLALCLLSLLRRTTRHELLRATVHRTRRTALTTPSASTTHSPATVYPATSGKTRLHTSPLHRLTTETRLPWRDLALLL